MTTSFLQDVALWPAQALINLVLMLWGLSLQDVGQGWAWFVTGVVALIFWSNIIRLVMGRIKRALGFW